MSFFEPPTPPPEQPQPAPAPVWLGPPENVLGVGVPLQLLLAHTDRTAVAITGCVAYPRGVEFTLAMRLRPGSLSPPEQRALMHGGPFHLHGPHEGGELPPELLRLGVLFPDGRKATSVDDRRAFFQPGSEPDGPILTPRGGGGGGSSWNMGFWLWPLPPAGPLTFVVEWPALGIAETRGETDAAPIVAAAAAAEPLWPEQGPSGTWFSSTSQSVSSRYATGQNDDE